MLVVEGLTVKFPSRHGDFTAVEDVSLRVGAGEIHGLHVLFPDIEDEPNVVTRFLILSKQQALPSGNDKTSIMFTTADKPGALVAVLSVFDKAGVEIASLCCKSGQTGFEIFIFKMAERFTFVQGRVLGQHLKFRVLTHLFADSETELANRQWWARVNGIGRLPTIGRRLR